LEFDITKFTNSKLASSLPFEHLAKYNTSGLERFISEILYNLTNFKHDGQKRHLLKFIQLIDLLKFKEGKIVNICFDFLQKYSEGGSVKIQFINILYKFSKKNSDIKLELI